MSENIFSAVHYLTKEKTKTYGKIRTLNFKEGFSRELKMKFVFPVPDTIF
jgi:hypothetical protein